MTNNSNKYNSLRKKFQEFHYLGFTYHLNDNDLTIVYSFKIDKFVVFHPKLKFVKNTDYHFENIPKPLLHSLIFNIGMVELISYWKALVPKRVVIHGYRLVKSQVEFWRKLYFNGLGEFFYLNGIEPDYDDFMHFIFEGDTLTKPHPISLGESVIIPIGGGKDSVVSLELLKDFSEGNLTLIINPRGASIATVEAANYSDRLLIIERTIDKELLRFNALGYLNGHTPFSAMLAFVAVLAAAASGRKYIALSNENSANEPTIPGTKINHQYSKSIEFEEDFRIYLKDFITPDINYFSLLRPLSELQIAQLFSKNPKYFGDFKSCNVGSKTDSWCGKCPKCLFTFIILSPFVEPKILEAIFGTNLLNDPELEKYFNELTGISEIKPFECIGTVDEVNLALCMTRKKYENPPYLLKKHQLNFSDLKCDSEIKKFDFEKISDDHFVENKFLDISRNMLKENE